MLECLGMPLPLHEEQAVACLGVSLAYDSVAYLEFGFHRHRSFSRMPRTALVPLTGAMLVAIVVSATGHEQAFVPGFNAVFTFRADF